MSFVVSLGLVAGLVALTLAPLFFWDRGWRSLVEIL